MAEPRRFTKPLSRTRVDNRAAQLFSEVRQHLASVRGSLSHTARSPTNGEAVRVTKIAFRGYQRLIDTSCNTNGKMIAFVGPNEAGKTTLLRALDWFSNGQSLPARAASSRNPASPEEEVVSVTFWLQPEDVKAISDLGLAEMPKYFHRGRTADGKYYSTLLPMAGKRSSAPFSEARSQYLSARDLEEDPDPDPDESEPNLRLYDSTVLQSLENPDGTWNEAWDQDFNLALDRLRGMGHETAAVSLETVRDALKSPHPDAAARGILRSRIPQFALFSDADRSLASSYDLEDEDLRDNPPAALANLAWVANLDIDLLWQNIQEGNARRIATSERRANENLRERLGSKWTQRPLDVHFNVSGTELQIQIYETDEHGEVTPFHERSDGLRSFIALVAFLARHDFQTPPVLLVDEAEMHLHYDAQADLVEVLAKDVSATQVFYTTHSPGCLPRDLGTGVRLVSPVAESPDESRIRNDFWTSSGPGFTPLLFAMGAGAAAFSAFRRAVLTEGAGDMILLPSLIRLATGLDDLNYQVAPGIANYHGSGLELEEVAARVVYVVDGDEGGDDHLGRLKDMGIGDSRIFQLEKPWAVEDLIEPSIYLSTVNAFLELAGHNFRISIENLATSKSISKQVEDWCKDRGIRAPGKTIIATHLVDDQGILALAPGAKELLIRLHHEFEAAFSAAPSSL